MLRPGWPLCSLVSPQLINPFWRSCQEEPSAQGLGVTASPTPGSTSHPLGIPNHLPSRSYPQGEKLQEIQHSCWPGLSAPPSGDRGRCQPCVTALVPPIHSGDARSKEICLTAHISDPAQTTTNQSFYQKSEKYPFFFIIIIIFLPEISKTLVWVRVFCFVFCFFFFCHVFISTFVCFCSHMCEVLSHKKVFQPSSVPLWKLTTLKSCSYKTSAPFGCFSELSLASRPLGEQPRTTRKLCSIYMIWPHLGAEVLLRLCPIPPTGDWGPPMGGQSPFSLGQGEKEE